MCDVLDFSSKKKSLYLKWSESHSVCLTLSSHGLYSPWNSLGQNAGLDSLSILQEIFPTQGSNLGLPNCRQILYQLNHKGSLRILEWIAYPFSSRSSWPRNQTRVSCIAGWFFTNWAIREAQACTWLEKKNEILKIKVTFKLFSLSWSRLFQMLLSQKQMGWAGKSFLG